MDFGLGLVLSFTDNATAGINNAVNSLNQLTQTAESASNSLNQMASLSALSVVSNQIGNSMTNIGSSILGTFSNIVTGVQETGSEFQSLRITLNAMLKDEQKAEESLRKLMNFAATTPFEISDLTGIFTTITANGLDAFETLKGATTGVEESLLSAIGDLMAFRPDVPAQQWGVAIRNAFSGEVRSLKNALDINVNDMLGRDWGKSGDIAQDFIDLADAIGVAGMMQNNFENNMNVQMANMSDIITKIKLAIADTGVFDTLVQAVGNVSSALSRIDGDRLSALANSIGGALQFVLKPVVSLSKHLGNLIDKLVDFIGTHSSLVKMIAVITAVGGVLLVLGGIALKFISAIASVNLMIVSMGHTWSTIGGVLKTGALKMLGTLIPLTATIALLALAWKSDFAGIRTNTTYFVTNLVTAFKTARQAVNGSVSDLVTTLSDLRNKGDFFSNLTIGIMKVMVLFKALADGWNDYTLSEDVFLKAKELGILPLVEAILDLKYRFSFFKQGFLEGWKNISDIVVGYISTLANSLDGTIFEDLLNNVTKFLQKLSSNDPQAWKDFGVIIGELSAKFVLVYTAVKLFDGAVGKVAGAVTIFSTLGRVVQTVASLFGNLGGVVSDIITKLFPNLYKVVEKGLQHVFGSNIQGIIPHLKIWFAGVQDAIIGAVTGIASALGAPVWAVVAVIVAILSSIIAYAVTNWEEFKAKILTIWTTLKDEAVAIWNSLKEGVVRIFENLKSAISPVVNAFNNLKTKFAEMIHVIGQNEKVQAFIKLLSAVGETIVNILVPVINMIVKVVSEALQGIWNFLVTTFNAIVNVVSSVLAEVMNIIGGILDIIVGIFTLDFGKILSGVGTIFTSILNVVTTVLTSVWNIIQSILTTVANVFKNILTGVVNTVTGAFNGIASVIGTVLTNILNSITSKWNSIKTTISNVLNGISSTVKSIWNGIKSAVDSIVSNMSSSVKNKWNSIKSTVDSVLSSMSSSIQNKWNSIKSSISNAINGAKDAVKSAIDKIKSFFNFKWSLPKLKLPHLTITGGFSISPPKVPKFSIDWYEKGGVFNSPSVIGVGENGQEAVMPLEKNTGWIGLLADKLVGHASNLIPTNSSQSEVVNQGDTTNSQKYLTNNSSTTQTYQGDTDNSIVFNEGAIQVNVQNASEEEAIRMAKKIMEYIKRQRELDRMMAYA